MAAAFARVAAAFARSGPPPRDFLRKFLRDLRENKRFNLRDLHGGFTTRRAALGAADLNGLRPHAAGPQENGGMGIWRHRGGVWNGTFFQWRCITKELEDWKYNEVKVAVK